MQTYIARSRESDEKEQSLLDHLEGVAERARNNASAFKSGDLAYICGRIHDIGKYSVKFQRRIRGANISVDHSTAGGQWIYQNGSDPILAMLAAYCCMGHHGGLPDGGVTLDKSDEPSLHGRLKKKIEEYNIWQSEITEALTLKSPGVQPCDGFGIAFFVRMLFSSLVDADYIDTETFMSETQRSRGGFTEVKELYKKLEASLEKYLKSEAEANSLNAYRTDLLKSCLDAAEGPGGLFSLTAPTGSGKTNSGLAFAFKHAALYGKRRVIYVAPYNTIIEQNAAEFEEMFGGANVLRHYGNYYYDDDSEESSNKRFSAENWDFPMITTSSVQFLQSLFANRSSMCRKLHNIANSVIILDEAQMIPVPFLMPCVRAIAELVMNYGCTVLLATATQVKLEKYLGGLTPYEIVKDPIGLHNVLKRNHIKVMENPIGDDELAEKLSTSNQVLCILNTRLHAQKLFERVHHLCGEGVYHLSTTLYPLHRTQILETIRQRLDDNLPCRVISTSMIEAGVDVDFPVVYRAQAGLDSIVQAAGRCNREGNHPTDESIVYTFISETYKPPAGINQNIMATQQTLNNHSDLASPEAVTDYFEQLFYNKGTKQLDVYDIIPKLNNGFNPKSRINSFSFPFREVAQKFRIIEDNTKTVYVLLEAPELEKRAACGERSRELFRELSNYAVSLYAYDIKKLEEVGALVHLCDNYSGKDEITILAFKEYYDKDFGVPLTPDSGKALLS